MKADPIMRVLIFVSCGILAACGPAKDDRIVAEAKAHAKAWSAGPAKRLAAEQAAEQAAAVAAVDAAPDCAADRFKFVADERLSMFELAALVEAPDQLATAKGPRLMFLPFDYDLHPTRGEWGAAGIIYVAGDPPDRRTVGGVLWTRVQNFLSEGGGKIADGPDGQVLTVSLAPDYTDPKETKIICVGRFRATLSADGTLTAGGKKVGVFH